MSNLSVVVSAYNEESKISRCLEAVKGWTDEVIVIDCSSTDNTEKIVRKYTSKVFSRPNYEMLNTNKNFGFSKSKSDWILNLDADEEVTAQLRQEILEVIGNPGENNGYWIPRKNIIFGKWIQTGLWWPDYQLRLFRRGKGKFPEIHVHEYLKVDGLTSKLTSPMVHHNYQTVSQYIRKIDQIYSNNEVANLISADTRFSWQDALRFPLSDFLKVYFAQGAYKDGLHGLVLSIFQAFYSFIVFAKFWEHNNFKQINPDTGQISKEVKYNLSEMLYWQYELIIREENIPIIVFFRKLTRKFMRKIISI